MVGARRFRMMRTLDLRENEPKCLPERELEEGTALRIGQSGLVHVEFPSVANQRRYVLRASGVIGLIPVGKDLMIRVIPKVPVANLFSMLERVHGLKSFRLYEGIGRVQAIEDIYERLARMLASGVMHRVRKGLDSDYQTFHDDLNVVRGRISIPDSLRLQAQGATRLRCEYQARTVDIDRNRILLWALDRISRLGLPDGATIEEVRAARRALLGPVALAEMSAGDCKRQQYNRLNADYAILHAIARFFIERMGPGIADGDHHFVPFTVNMATLFQEYVVACLKAAAPTGVIVQRQHHVTLEGDLDVSFQMDAVVVDERTGKALIVVDAKYKADAKPTAADIQQVVAYAAHLGAPRALLVYPTLLQSPGRVTVGSLSRIEVRTVGLPLDGRLELADSRLKNETFPSHQLN